MSFTIKIRNHTLKFDHKTSILDIIKEYDPEKRAVAARVNNRVRELTYEINKNSEVEILTVKDHEAIKVYEASLRYVVAMAFARCYPGLKIRFAYNVSRAVSIAREGDVVLMSPACAAFDQFENFAVRGDHFREIINRIKDFFKSH